MGAARLRLVGLVRGRGAWLANAAAILAVLGATTLPGFLIVDFYDIAIVDTVGAEAYEDVSARLEELPGATVLFVTGLLGHLLCLPAALFAAWRGGLFPLWVPLTVTLATLAAQVLTPFGSGLLILAVGMLVLAFALSRLGWNSRDAIPA